MKSMPVHSRRQKETWENTGKPDLPQVAYAALLTLTAGSLQMTMCTLWMMPEIMVCSHREGQSPPQEASGANPTPGAPAALIPCCRESHLRHLTCEQNDQRCFFALIMVMVPFIESLTLMFAQSYQIVVVDPYPVGAFQQNGVLIMGHIYINAGLQLAPACQVSLLLSPIRQVTCRPGAIQSRISGFPRRKMPLIAC